MTRRLALQAAAAIALAVVVGCGSGSDSSASLKELQRVNRDGVTVVLLSPSDALRQGKNSLVLEFRDSSGNLIDVGTVMANASMTMAGMAPMLATTTVERGDSPGRYRMESDFSMAGAWRVTTEWNGPRGSGSVSFPGAVR